MRTMTDAIVLCGGAGLRLRSVTGDGPKPMARIAGRPFLEVLLKQLRRHGFQRIILAVGYRQDAIHSHFGNEAFNLTLEYSQEQQPLGTGGALANAAQRVESNNVLVLNGDSYTDADLAKFSTRFAEAQSDASLLVVPSDGRRDCGLVALDEHGGVLGFSEKNGTPESGYVNAGIYMLTSRLLQEIPAGRPFSLEEQLFPQWLKDGRRIEAVVFQGKCIDIGTQQRYRLAQELLANAESEAAETLPLI